MKATPISNGRVFSRRLSVPVLVLFLLALAAVCQAETAIMPDEFLEDEPKPTGRLYVKVEPADARVMLLKIKPKYHDGIELEQGTYTIKAVKDGFEPKTITVKIEPGRDNVYDIVLSKAAASTARPASGGAKRGQVWVEPATGMQFVWVPGGCFQMGSRPTEAESYSNEEPAHEVCVDGFWMGKYEVTNAQYRKYQFSHKSKDYKGRYLDSDDQPVVRVSWNETKGYAAWLSSQGGGNFRLPTEAEWEYAARAGTRTARSWGDSPDQACSFANVGDQSVERQWPDWETHNCNDGHLTTAPVGSFRPNGFGLHDMLGNVSEWCEDVYDARAYSSHSRQNPISSAGGSSRVNRGGCWLCDPGEVRSAYRTGYSAGHGTHTMGFRLVRTP